MSLLRRAKRVDNNQKSIVDALRKIPGVTVQLDANDILVGRNGVTWWYEIKKDEKAASEARLKDSQRALLKNWKGHYRVVWSIEQILEDIN